MCTAAAGSGQEAVFVLDHGTGFLRGAYLYGQAGEFTAMFGKKVAEDFGSPTNPEYAMVAGFTGFLPAGGTRLASGVLYVTEKKLW